MQSFRCLQKGQQASYCTKNNPMLTVNNQIDGKNIRWAIQVSPLKWQGLKYNEDSQFS